MDNEYCCLGVLCEVAGIPATLNARNEIYSYDGALITLPHQLKLRSIVEQCNLVEMNDSGDYTFDEIADYIETKGIEAVANATI